MNRACGLTVRRELISRNFGKVLYEPSEEIRRSAVASTVGVLRGGGGWAGPVIGLIRSESTVVELVWMKAVWLQ